MRLLLTDDNCNYEYYIVNNFDFVILFSTRGQGECSLNLLLQEIVEKSMNLCLWFYFTSPEFGPRDGSENTPSLQLGTREYPSSRGRWKAPERLIQN